MNKREKIIFFYETEAHQNILEFKLRMCVFQELKTVPQAGETGGQEGAGRTRTIWATNSLCAGTDRSDRDSNCPLPQFPWL